MSHQDRTQYPAASGAGAQSGTAGEQRGSARCNLLIRPAKLITSMGEYLCVMRDVSPGGCKVRVFHPIASPPQMVLELGNGDRYEVERVWERDGHAGFRFRAAVPVEYLLNETGPFRKRPVRVRVQQPALIVSGREAAAGMLLDISQQGARVACEAGLAQDQQVRLEIAGLPAIVAKIRWRRSGAVGLVFETTFKLDELALVVARLQPAPPTPEEAETLALRAKYG
jgi:hypothetical protein